MSAEDSAAAGILLIGGFALIGYFVFALPGVWLASRIWKRELGGMVWPWLFAVTISLFVAPAPLSAHHVYLILPAPLSWASALWLGLPVGAWHFAPAGTAFVFALGAGLLKQRHIKEGRESEAIVQGRN